LPFAAASLDLVVLPHALECSSDPHATLREVERVLVPDGRVVICGFNPISLWSVRQGLGQVLRRIGLLGRLGPLYLPASGESIGLWRLRDWLRLLSFDTAQVRYGCYVPPVRSVKWLARWGFVERLGVRWWPILGAAYVVVGVKRVRGMRLMATAWKPKPQRAAQTAPVASHLEAGKRSIPHE
jgi:SAM-dependent methyltransferase